MYYTVLCIILYYMYWYYQIQDYDKDYLLNAKRLKYTTVMGKWNNRTLCRTCHAPRAVMIGHRPRARSSPDGHVELWGSARHRRSQWLDDAM